MFPSRRLHEDCYTGNLRRFVCVEEVIGSIKKLPSDW
nr:MAG TPA: hypothetical protein [Caudoviricetes sp.]